MLVELGVVRSDHGDLHKALDKGFADTAKIIAGRGGLSIPAHADREKGLLRLAVADRINQTLLDDAISAVEIVEVTEAERIKARLDGRRELALVRSSDTTAPGVSWHVLRGIGHRRTWIKASRPDLRGLRHALADPELRVGLDEPGAPEHTVIESVTVTGGFLDGQRFQFSCDLNCLLGGTGAGKSLLIELVRFALDQQTDAGDFPPGSQGGQLPAQVRPHLRLDCRGRPYPWPCAVPRAPGVLRGRLHPAGVHRRHRAADRPRRPDRDHRVLAERGDRVRPNAGRPDGAHRRRARSDRVRNPRNGRNRPAQRQRPT
ncbi:ATP-binding protein [Micromonospora sp. ANENR4]|uniref:ATP-binding protein n=1 Tax=Micromonospora sp. ANENR4 TaxID=2783662 RepID=UPI00210639E2|nr:ATP-binding protein [Micromonospora sp. ANENR4]